MQQFQFALETVKEAGRAAADRAVMITKEFTQKAPRIQLDIQLQAPIVVVPQHSRSDNAIVADLGNISLANSFRIVDGKVSAVGMPAVLEEMSIHMTDLKFVR